MLVFFLRFMRQKSGRHICTQLLQTLNILFENISNETSVCEYYSAKLCCIVVNLLRQLMEPWTKGLLIKTHHSARIQLINLFVLVLP